MMKVMAAGLALLASVPAAAQLAPAPQAAPAPDPARLKAARALLDLLMPPATREQMIGGMMTPMLANIQRGFSDNPAFARAIGADPQMKAMFDSFMQRQLARTTETIRAGLPGMIEAMTRAYARRFDVAQLDELRRFFGTPTGQAYMREGLTIMADPDVAAWQREMMSRSMSQVQADVADFARQVAASEQKRGKP